MLLQAPGTGKAQAKMLYFTDRMYQITFGHACARW